MSIFSDTLIFLRSRSNLSREELSTALNVSCTHIKRLETDYIKPDDDILKSLAEYFGVTVAYLLGGNSNALKIDEPGFRNSFGRFLSVPVLDTHHAMNRVISDTDVIDRIVLPVKGNNAADYVGVLIDDENLGCERMRKGDIAIVEITNQLHSGDLVAVNYKNDVVFFRRYSRLGPTVILTTEKAYDPITYDVSDTEYKILGKVIAFHGTL